MVLVVALFALLSTSFAQHRTRCGLDSEIGTTLKLTGDGVEGRYTIEWCSKLPDKATTWNLKLNYIDFHNSSKECPESNSVRSSLRLKGFMKIHSVVTEELEKPFNCGVTCLSKPLDLIFTGCYVARSQLSNRSRTWHPDTAALVVHNRFSGEQAFNDLRPFYLIEKDGDTLTIQWDLHYIPVSEYTMEITEYKNSSDMKGRAEGTWVPIQENCTHETYSVTCRVRAPPPRRCVLAALQHAAPWRGGDLFKDANRMVYCSPASASVKVWAGAGAGAGAAWWAAGALLLALALLAALWAAHSRLLADLRKRTLRDWTQRYSQYTAERDPKAPAPTPPGHVLLLYARDCAPAMECVQALKDMLEAGAPGRVYDLFSPECVSLYAAAPAAWLRGVLRRADVRVLLLQTPACAALYDTQLDDSGLRLQEPLLGSAVQYRRPQYGDALLQAALRMIRDTALHQPEYTKYYIATISELQSEVMPQVSCYRRYVLPEHATALLRDLRVPAEPEATRCRLQRLADAVQSLLHYVRGNENYLKDELMFLGQLEQ